MRGEIVVCKDFIGNELEMIVWDKDESFIFVHTKDQFSAHKAQLSHLEPVGFPVEDVFRRDSATGKLVPICPSAT